MGGSKAFCIVGERGAYGVQRNGEVLGWHRIRIDAEIQKDRHEATWNDALDAAEDRLCSPNVTVGDLPHRIEEIRQTLRELKA